MEAINKLFAPEFRNRLDATISFGHLPKEVVQKVVDKFVMQLEAQLADRNVTIELTDEARDWLVEHGYDEAMGARPMARLIQSTIKTPLADDVLFGRLKDGGAVRVDRQDGRDRPARASASSTRRARRSRSPRRTSRNAAKKKRQANAQPIEAEKPSKPKGGGDKGGAAASAPFRRFRWFAHKQEPARSRSSRDGPGLARAANREGRLCRHDDRRSRRASRGRPGHHAPGQEVLARAALGARRRRIWFEEVLAWILVPVIVHRRLFLRRLRPERPRHVALRDLTGLSRSVEFLSPTSRPPRARARSAVKSKRRRP